MPGEADVYRAGWSLFKDRVELTRRSCFASEGCPKLLLLPSYLSGDAAAAKQGVRHKCGRYLSQSEQQKQRRGRKATLSLVNRRFKGLGLQQ